MMAKLKVLVILLCVQRVTQGKKRLGFFWHLTDVHYDLDYCTYGDAENECHESAANTFGKWRKPGAFGEPRCDSPERLVSSVIKAMRQHSTRQPDFIIWTGAKAAVGGEDHEKALGTIETATRLVAEAVAAALPGTRLLPCLSPLDYHPPGHLPARAAGARIPFYRRLAALFRRSLRAHERVSFALAGYYAHELAPRRLLIIVLNTALFLSTHVASREPDPAGQWTWLERQLIGARETGLKAFLVMSAPPGSLGSTYRVPGAHFFRPIHNRNYILLVRKYRDVIAGQFAGHFHVDAIRVFYSRTEKPVGWMLIAPSVSPRRRFPEHNLTIVTNPAIRLYTYDIDAVQVEDYEQFYLPLEEANKAAKGSIAEGADTWMLYRFTSFHNVSDLSLASMQTVASGLSRDDAGFRRYIDAHQVFRPHAECGEACRRFHACAAQNVDYAALLECLSAREADEKRVLIPLAARAPSLRPAPSLAALAPIFVLQLTIGC